jgi:hypothetical protein
MGEEAGDIYRYRYQRKGNNPQERRTWEVKVVPSAFESHGSAAEGA